VDQPRLFRLAVESGAVAFRHEPGRGWHMTITCRRGDETWLDSQTDTYSGMTTAELLDTMHSALDGIL
jgi:hypothetical protein